MTRATGHGATGYEHATEHTGGTGGPRDEADPPAPAAQEEASGSPETGPTGAGPEQAGLQHAVPEQPGPENAGPHPGPDPQQPPRPQVRPARRRPDSYPRTSAAAAEYFGGPAPAQPDIGGGSLSALSRRLGLSRPRPDQPQPPQGTRTSPPPRPTPPRTDLPEPPRPAPPGPYQHVPPPSPQPGPERAPRPAVPPTTPQDVDDYAPWQTPLSPPPAAAPEPKEGWRAALYGLSGRRLNFGLSANERRIEAWLRTIDTPVTNHCIATMNVKGGAGKTTTTIAMGTAFAMHRRDQCIGIDANPDRGNLAQRLGQEHLYTIRDLLDNLDEITGAHTLRKFTNQASSRFEVIASDRDPVKARAFTPHEYRTVQQVVRAFRQVILTDTGIDLTNPVVDAVLQATDTLVVAASTAQDVAGLAWETLNTVEQRGFDHLVQRAVVSIIKEPSGEQVPLAELRSAFQDRCRAVVVIPNDRSLVGGGWFDWQALNPATRRAYLELAARVAEDFTTSRPW